MQLPLPLYIAWHYIRHNLRQSAIVALAVGIGVSIIIFIPSVNLSFFDYFLHETVENAAHIRVTREVETMPRNKTLMAPIWGRTAQILYSDQTMTRNRKITAYRDAMDRLTAIPGVTAAAPYINERVIVVRGSQDRGATVQGIEPLQEAQIHPIKDDIQQGNLDKLSGDQIFIGWRLADELGVGMGDRIQLVSVNNKRSFKIAGLIRTGIYMQDMDTMYIALRTAQTLFDLPNQVSGISLKVDDINAADKVASVIQSAYGYKTRTWMEDNEVILDQIRMFRVIIAFISFLIVFAAASSITSILIMLVSSKAKEIGILKAMGTTSGAIVQLFLFQAIFLSILGAIAGVFGGMGLIELYNATPYSKAETFLGIARQPVTLNLEYTGYAIFYAMLSSIFASIFPAWRAGSLDPVKAFGQ
ncbi:MAG: ABC transporter permease [Candidatus Melainabacteria bacterium]